MLSIELEGRVFGGGALEILPGDLKNVRIPLIEGISNTVSLFEELDNKFRNNESIYDIVRWVDEQLFKSGKQILILNWHILLGLKKNTSRYDKINEVIIWKKKLQLTEEQLSSLKQEINEKSSQNL